MADEISIVLSDIDEVEIDASLSDEIEITLSEVDDIEVMVFDYPAEIDLLTDRVKANEYNASDVKLTADGAAELAELARITASTAVTGIVEHETSTENPHSITATQELADVSVTSLANEATYSSSVWAYLVGLFTAVPKSVKEHLAKVWIILNDLDSRVELLEADIIYSTTITEDVKEINIEGIDIKEGKHIEMLLSCGANSCAAKYMLLRVNGISTSNYMYSTAVYSGLMIPCGNDFFTTKVSIYLIGGNAIAEISYVRSLSGTKSSSTMAVGSFNLEIDNITSLQLVQSYGGYLPKQKILLTR